MATRMTKLMWLIISVSLVPLYVICTFCTEDTSGPSSPESQQISRQLPINMRNRMRFGADRKDLIEADVLPLTWNTSEEHIRELAARRQNVLDVCKELGLDHPSATNKLNAWEFIINKQYNLVWCNVFKAASSTWFWNFNILAGYKEKNLIKADMAPVELARKAYPRPTVDELKAVLAGNPPPLSFMIARHPLERLVSAYCNKILAANAIYKPYFKKIYLLYKDLGPPVPRRNKDGDIVGKDVSPSFRQFVQYVLDREKQGQELDMHWIPQSRFCTPCLANFSIYAKVDTLEEDGNHIIFSSGINSVIKPKKINRSKTPTSSITNTFICQLSDAQFEGLLALYSLDLRLFQFDSMKYRHCHT